MTISDIGTRWCPTSCVGFLLFASHDHLYEPFTTWKESMDFPHCSTLPEHVPSCLHLLAGLLRTSTGLGNGFPCTDLGRRRRIRDVPAARAGQVFVKGLRGGRCQHRVGQRRPQPLSTHREPRRPGRIHDRILSRSIFANVVQPRVPLWRNLRCVEVVLRIVDPSVTAWDLFVTVQILKVLVAKLIRADCGAGETRLAG